MDTDSLALLCKALGDCHRLKIVQLLSEGEKCGCRLLDAFAFSQPTLSHHMQVLCQSGLVQARRQGKRCYYSLCPQAIQALQIFINALARNQQNS